jgi:hypothetical protein
VIRRNIIKPVTAPPPARKVNERRLAALRAHLTRNHQAQERWNRRLRRAFKEFFKYQKKVVYFQNQISREEAP